MWRNLSREDQNFPKHLQPHFLPLYFKIQKQHAKNFASFRKDKCNQLLSICNKNISALPQIKIGKFLVPGESLNTLP